MPWITSLLLSVIAGYVDTMTFLEFHGLFAAHVTGNFVLFAVAIGTGVKEADYLKLVAFPVFVVAILVTTWIHDRLPDTTGVRRSWGLLWTVSAILIAVGMIALLPLRTAEVDYGLALALVAAMGVQNALHRLYAQFGPSTTAMTGNVAHLAVNAMRRMTGWQAAHAQSPRGPSFSDLLWLVVGFAAGCGLAVPMTNVFGLAAVLLPGIALTGALLTRERLLGGS